MSTPVFRGDYRGMTLLGVLLAQLLVKPVRVRRRARLAMATCRED